MIHICDPHFCPQNFGAIRRKQEAGKAKRQHCSLGTQLSTVFSITQTGENSM